MSRSACSNVPLITAALGAGCLIGLSARRFLSSGCSKKGQEIIDSILGPAALRMERDIVADTKGDRALLSQAGRLVDRLQQRTKHGILRCDYEYLPTRGDPGTALSLTFGPEPVIIKVEGWTFEAAQRGPNPATGKYPAAEFRLVKANGERDPYWSRLWEAETARSGYRQVTRKEGADKHDIGYFEPADYAKGLVYRYDPDVVEAKMREAVQALTKAGVGGISADVGYSQQFQTSVAGMTHKAVIMSSLQQLCLVSKLYALGPKRKIVVLTANKGTFDPAVMIPAGVPHEALEIVGMECNVFGQGVAGGKSFSRFTCDKWDDASVEESLEAVMAEAVQAVDRVTAQGGQVCAFVNECTELPAYTNYLRDRMGVPVYDIITAINFVQAGSGFALHAAYLPGKMSC